MTLDDIKARCTECPDCGGMWLWPLKNSSSGPELNHKVDGKWVKTKVRRLVWQLKNPGQTLPDGRRMVISSRCKNSRCVNPEKVYRTTKTEAFKRAAARGSWKNPVAHAKVARSIRARSKLPEEGVQDIVTGEDPPAEAAKKWGVSTAYVYMLRRGLFRQPLANPFAGLGAR